MQRRTTFLLVFVIAFTLTLHTVYSQYTAEPGQYQRGNISAGSHFVFELPEIKETRQGVSVDINVTSTGPTEFCVYIKAGSMPYQQHNVTFSGSDDHICIGDNHEAMFLGARIGSVYSSPRRGQKVYVVIVERKNANTAYSLFFNQGASACAPPRLMLSICNDPSPFSKLNVPKRSILYKGDEFLSAYITDLYIDCGAALKTATCSRTYAPCDSNGVQQKQCRRACSALQSSCTNVLVNGKPIANIQCENNEEYTLDDNCFYAQGTVTAIADIIIKSLIITGTVLAILVISVLVTVVVCCLYYAKPKKSVDYRIL